MNGPSPRQSTVSQERGNRPWSGPYSRRFTTLSDAYRGRYLHPSQQRQFPQRMQTVYSVYPELIGRRSSSSSQGGQLCLTVAGRLLNAPQVVY